MKKVLSYILVICLMAGMTPFVFDAEAVYADQNNAVAIMSFASNSPSLVAMLTDDVYYINDDAGAFTTVGADAENYNSYFDGTENRLVLKDAVITAGALAIVANRDTIIELNGNNYIESYVFGIDDENNSDSSLIITGSGVLEVHALKHPTGMVNNTGGVAVRRNLIIGGNARLKAYGAEDESATSHSGTQSFGIYLMGGGLTVRDNAVVEAYGQNAVSTDSDAESYGVCVASDVTITGSAVLSAYAGDAVTAEDRHAYSMAVYTGSGNVSVGADARLIAEGGDAQLGATGSNPSNHPVSFGVNAGIDVSQSNHTNNHKNISIYGRGRIDASAGQATYIGSGSGVEPESYGLYADSILLNGGSLSAESDNAGGGSLELSYGIRALAGFTAANAVIQAEDILADSDFTMTGANASVLNLKADNVTVSDASNFSGRINTAGTVLFNDSSYSLVITGANSDASAISASAVTVTDSSFDITLDNQFRNITLIDTGNLSFNNTSFNADLSAAEATGSAKVLRCSNFNCEGGSIDIALCNASAGSIGIDCASFTLTDAESAVISGSTAHEDTYAIKATGAVNISSGAVLSAAHIAGLGAGGSFTLAEGLHWATAAGVTTTNGAYTWSADDNYLIVTTGAIVIPASSPSHSGGSSGSAGAGTGDSGIAGGEGVTSGSAVTGGAVAEKIEVAGTVIDGRLVITDVAASQADIERTDTGIRFTDTENRWFADAAAFAGRLGLMNGRSAFGFAGDAGITRAEFSTILLRVYALAGGAVPGEKAVVGLDGIYDRLGSAGYSAAELSGSVHFSDVRGTEWFGNVAGMAFGLGIAKGGEGASFGGSNEISRQEAMVMIHRLSVLVGILKGDEGGAMGLAGFEDSGSVAGWAYESMGYGVRSGLIEGYDGHIDPAGNITRGQTATILQRLLVLMVK